MITLLLLTTALAGEPTPEVDPHEPGWHCYVMDKIADPGNGVWGHSAPDIQAAATWRSSWTYTNFLTEVAPDSPVGTVLQIPADNGANILCSKVGEAPAEALSAPPKVTSSMLGVIRLEAEEPEDLRVHCRDARDAIAAHNEAWLLQNLAKYGAVKADENCFAALSMSEAARDLLDVSLR